MQKSFNVGVSTKKASVVVECIRKSVAGWGRWFSLSSQPWWGHICSAVSSFGLHSTEEMPVEGYEDD